MNYGRCVRWCRLPARLPNYNPGKDGGGVEICFARLLNCLPLHNALLRAAKIHILLHRSLKPDANEAENSQDINRTHSIALWRHRWHANGV